MMKLRYSIWRRSIPLFWALIVPCIAGAIYFSEVPLGFMFEVLIVVVFAAGIAFHVVVSLLDKAGLLEFTYTEADRCSYLYNQKKVYQQMTDNRRAKKRE